MSPPGEYWPRPWGANLNHTAVASAPRKLANKYPGNRDCGVGEPWKYVGGRPILVEKGGGRWALQMLGMACEVSDSMELEGEAGNGQGVRLVREAGAGV